MMKKLIIIALVAVMALGATSCSSKSQNSSSEAKSQQTGTIAVTEAKTEEATNVPVNVDAIKPGNYTEHDNLKFSFESAKQYSEIKSEYYTDKPGDRKVYVVLNFEVENISKEEQHLNMFYTKSYVDDYKADQKSLINVPGNDDYEMLSGDIGVGKKQKCYVAYEIDENWKKLEMTYTDGVSSNSPKYDFIVTPDDLSK